MVEKYRKNQKKKKNQIEYSSCSLTRCYIILSIGVIPLANMHIYDLSNLS